MVRPVNLGGQWILATARVSVLMLLFLNSCGSAPEALYPPLDSLDIEVTGSDFQWHIRYPGRDGRLDTPDDVHSLKNIHVPVHVMVKIQLKSKDYLYSLALPHLGLKQLAVPAMVFPLEFEAESTGSFPFLGDQLCGYSHPSLMGELIVQSREDFESWLEENQR